MIVDTNAYVWSLIMVLVGCIIRDFIIPLIVWRKHLKGRSYSYRFLFCVITQASLQINLVLLLGILNICNRVTFIGCNVLVYLLVIWNYSDKQFFTRSKSNLDNLWNAYKEERLARYLFQSVNSYFTNQCRTISHWPIWGYLRRNWLEMLLLVGIIIYNIWFMTHNVMLYHSYQFSDITVHQSWIYELENGTLFSDGIYPFGMHAMIYFIRIVFGFNLREIMLYAGSYQFIILILAAYLLAKQIFSGKYVPITSIIIVSLMLNQGRYAASLPQEAGMYAVVALAYFMIRYLHRDNKKYIIESDTKLRRFFRINAYINRRYISSEMMLLMLCVGLVIAYHFYTAIVAFFVVIAVGLAYITRIFKKQYFVPLMFCGVMGAMIAIIPTGVALVKGIPFQESIEWATTVMAGEEWQGSESDYQDNLDSATGKEKDEDNQNSSNIPDTTDNDNADTKKRTVKESIKHYFDSMYYFGTMAMFGQEATILMFGCMITGLLCGLMMLLLKKTRVFGHDYIALILIMLVLFTFGASKELGLPELIAAARASTFAQPFIGIIYMLPIDFIFRILGVWKNRSFERVLRYLSLVLCGIIAMFIVEAGWYHDFFDVNQAYYNETEYVLRHIKQSYKQNTYTIVSPTDEYYDVVDHGRHTELSHFMNMVNGKEESFVFTTDYVFFFIEKTVLQDYNYGPVQVDLKYAKKEFVYMADVQDYYFQRAVLESQAYYWAKAFASRYPRNFKVFFEDDIFIVYRMEQNTYSPYDMQIDYLKLSRFD